MKITVPGSFLEKLAANFNAIKSDLLFYSLSKARLGILAAHKVVQALAASAADAPTLSMYARMMRNLTEELVAVTDALLAQGDKAYQAITASLKGSAAELKAIKERADSTAASLNLGSDVLSSFSKFVASVNK